MPYAEMPPNERERVAALYARQLLDTPPEERFDRVSRLATRSLEVPIAYVAFLDGERQWFKSVCGLDLTQVPRRTSLCSHTILSMDPIICPDTLLEPRFADNPNVVGPPNIRFYMGHPLSTPEGLNIGTFCVMDTKTHEVTSEKRQAFLDLAQWAQNELNLIDVLTLQEALLEGKTELRRLNSELEKRSHFIRSVLGRYLTDQVADQLLEHPEGLNLGGESREVSILMSDLRGFTPMSERSTPAQVVELLNRYLARMTPVIEKHGGTIDEFIGDAILVIFGAPLACADHASRAVACALDMQLAMDEFNRESLTRGAPAMEMGIAVNTGEVVVGNIGSATRMKYGVVGSAVNMTARIQSFTLGGQVLVSERTLKELNGMARVDGHLRVKVKGVDEPVCIYDVGEIRGQYGLSLPLPKHLAN
ncbi:MAG: adenylate/guanylate cyclase domain-containing protein [Vulcanimicrobiota bacterium]